MNKTNTRRGLTARLLAETRSNDFLISTNCGTCLQGVIINSLFKTNVFNLSRGLSAAILRGNEWMTRRH